MRSIIGVRLRAFAAALTLFFCAAEARAYPDRPVTIVAPYGAGGSSDTILRFIAQKLSAKLGQSFVVENKPGSGGVLAYRHGKAAPADGYTLVYGTSSLPMSQLLRDGVQYDAKTDFSPIISLVRIQNVLVVTPTLPIQNVADLIRYAKERPGKISFVSLGAGSTPHLVMELFRSAADINIVDVPYRQTTQGFVDLVEGRVQLWFASMPATLPFISTGKLRPLAVSGAARSPKLPDVPTVKELGLPFATTFWNGLFAPRGTPQEVVNILNQALNQILAEPETMSWLASVGAEITGGKAEDLANELESDLRMWGPIVKKLNLKLK